MDESGSSSAINTTTTSEPFPFVSLSSYTCFHLNSVNFELSGSSIPYIVNCALNIISSIVAVLGNSVALRAIWKVSGLNMPAKILIFNLAITDFAIGLIVQPLFVTTLVLKIQGVRNTALCVCSMTFIVVSSCTSTVSLMTVAAISLDRYIALYLHLRYNELVTNTRVLLLLCVIWSSGVLAGTVWLWNYKLFDPYAVFSAVVLITLVTSTAYFKVYQIVRHHQAQIQAQLRLQARIQAREDIEPQRNAENCAPPKRSTTTMLVIYCLLLVCYIPYISLEVVIKNIGLSPTMELLREFLFTLYLSNSSLNPVVYCWRLKEIRLAVHDAARNVSQGTKRYINFTEQFYAKRIERILIVAAV